MAFNEARKIMKDLQAVEKQINQMTSVAGTMAQNHFITSFRNQGFTDDVLQRWQARKKKDPGRAILVKSGALRRSIRMRNAGMFKVVIFSSLPYAEIQNDGGIIQKKSRSHTLSFNGGGRFQRQRTQRQRSGTAYQQKVTIGAHATRIPSRRFIGYSGALNRKILRKFDQMIRKVFS